VPIEGFNFGIPVNTTIDLDDQTQFRTIKVDDERPDHLLPTEFEAQNLPIPQDLPSTVFRFG
jgi:hypothetical protein